MVAAMARAAHAARAAEVLVTAQPMRRAARVPGCLPRIRVSTLGLLGPCHDAFFRGAPRLFLRMAASRL
jgi:hypothetical protein